MVGQDKIVRVCVQQISDSGSQSGVLVSTVGGRRKREEPREFGDIRLGDLVGREQMALACRQERPGGNRASFQRFWVVMQVVEYKVEQFLGHPDAATVGGVVVHVRRRVGTEATDPWYKYPRDHT